MSIQINNGNNKLSISMYVRDCIQSIEIFSSGLRGLLKEGRNLLGEKSVQVRILMWFMYVIHTAGFLCKRAKLETQRL